MRRSGRVIGILLSCFLLSVFLLLPVNAEEEGGEGGGEKTTEEIKEELLGQFDFDGMDASLEELFPQEKLGFKETVLALMSGDLTLTSELLNRLVMDQLTYAFRTCRTNLIRILLIALIAAVFSNFSGVFQNRQISEVSFYILYLLLIALCLNSFQAAAEWIGDGIKGLTSFMGVFCPLYFGAVAIAKGSVTAVAFYQLVLFIIYLAEFVMVSFVLPMIQIHMMLGVLNHLTQEPYLDKMSDLIGTVIAWSLKTLVACIVGLNVIQGLISPAIDTVKRSVITRSAEAVPGVGDAIGGVTEVVLGTAVLIKNAMGVTGAVVCLSLCIVPLIQTGAIVLLYRLAAAIVQPVSDKRVAGCIECVGISCQLLMRVVFTTGLLFLLTIVIVAAVTGNV